MYVVITLGPFQGMERKKNESCVGNGRTSSPDSLIKRVLTNAANLYFGFVLWTSRVQIFVLKTATLLGLLNVTEFLHTNPRIVL